MARPRPNSSRDTPPPLSPTKARLASRWNSSDDDNHKKRVHGTSAVLRYPRRHGRAASRILFHSRSFLVLPSKYRQLRYFRRGRISLGRISACPPPASSTSEAKFMHSHLVLGSTSCFPRMGICHAWLSTCGLEARGRG